MQFVDVKNDIAFWKIFGNEEKKIILISFLNAVLEFEGQDRIKEVVLLNPFQLPRIVNEKATVIDVKATDEKGQTFIIEMQVAQPRGFKKRVLYYTCKDYGAQLYAGEDYPNLRPVYFIGVLDFIYFPGKNYLTKHLIVEEKSGVNYFDDIKFRLIELPKFNKKEAELQTVIEKWVYFIKNARNLEMVPSGVEDEGLREAYAEAAQQNWSRTELDEYIKAGIKAQDDKGVVELATEKGIEIGKEEKAVEMIDKMLESGLSISLIAKVTGKTEEDVQKIIDARPIK